MGKVNISSKGLNKIISEAIREALSPAPNTYTFNQLLSKDILGQQYTGDAKMLAGYVMKGYQQLCKEKGIKTVKLTSNTPVRADQWVQVLNKAKAMDRTGTLQNTFNTMIQNLTAKSSVQGAQDALNKGGELTPANPYSTGPGNQNVAPNAGKKYTFTQLTQALGNKRGTTMSMQQVLHDSTGPWNGQDENAVKATIQAQIRRAKPALAQSNPQNAQKAEEILNKWMQGGIPYRTDDVHWAMNVFDQAVRTSRNDIPIVQGFQKAANMFAGKQVLAVDGAVGKNTSAALKQAGFNDIFDFKNTVMGVQKALGLKPDGIIGKNTMAAFQQAGINSFDVLKNYTNALAKRANAPTAIVNPGQMSMPNQTVQSQAPAGQLAESRKLRVTESELKSIIRESVNDVLKDMLRK